MRAGESTISVLVKYDDHVQKVTGVDAEGICVDGELPFVNFLAGLFRLRPEIEEVFKPGVLGLSLNGAAPKTRTLVTDGDVVELLVPRQIRN